MSREKTGNFQEIIPDLEKRIGNCQEMFGKVVKDYLVLPDNPGTEITTGLLHCLRSCGSEEALNGAKEMFYALTGVKLESLVAEAEKEVEKEAETC